jgi:hypothetical protein
MDAVLKAALFFIIECIDLSQDRENIRGNP